MEGHHLFKWYKLLILQVYHTIDPFASPILIIGKNRRGESLHEQENGNTKRRIPLLRRIYRTQPAGILPYPFIQFS